MAGETMWGDYSSTSDLPERQKIARLRVRVAAIGLLMFALGVGGTLCWDRAGADADDFPQIERHAVPGPASEAQDPTCDQGDCTGKSGAVPGQ